MAGTAPFNTGPGFTTIPSQIGSSSSTQQSTQSSSSQVQDTANAILSRMISSLASQYGTQIFQWAQSQIAPNTALTDQAVGTFMDAANNSFNLSNQISSDYNAMGRPALADLANTANSYSSAPRQQFAAGQAEANSMQGSEAGIDAAKQNLTSFGINPNSGMYAELDQSNKAAAGAAAAASGTQAAQQVNTTGLGLKQANVAAEQQLPGQAVNATTAGVGAVTGAANTQFGNTSTQANADAAANPFMATAQNIAPEGVISASSGQSSGSSTSSNLGNTIYTGGPGYTGLQGGLAGGGAIPDDATTGGFVSHKLSPSHGAITDDIPARLNADEFVMPKDVTRYYGHKTFQDMIVKARKAEGDPAQSPAHPTMKPAGKHFEFGGGAGSFGAGADNFGGSSSGAIPTGGSMSGAPQTTGSTYTPPPTPAPATAPTTAVPPTSTPSVAPTMGSPYLGISPTDPRLARDLGPM